jgi:hypothetical protein
MPSFESLPNLIMWKLESQHAAQMFSEPTNVFQAIALQEKNK